VNPDTWSLWGSGAARRFAFPVFPDPVLAGGKQDRRDTAGYQGRWRCAVPQRIALQKDTALKLRLPINGGVNALTVPTKEMMKGYYGALEAFDYRGRPVLAYNIAVPDTSWGMVVKMDTEEVLEHVRRLQSIVWIMAVFFIMGAGTVLWTWWKKQRIERLAHEKLASVAADLRISAIAFETHEAIVITDCHPKILRVNQAFQDITGYTAEEVIGRNPAYSGRRKKPRSSMRKCGRPFSAREMERGNAG